MLINLEPTYIQYIKYISTYHGDKLRINIYPISQKYIQEPRVYIFLKMNKNVCKETIFLGGFSFLRAKM